ncbi:methionyl-tRNA formyltransferase [Bacteroidetes bacterium UKL13-3]|nr:methionyl-tRNA formyltransferase [Bacteroidetes bacterium UKL13-3]HCP92883.1 methionyl-tRNA formyltransferase [Bacteroidota bacterium]
MNVIFLGTPDFSVPSLDAIIKAGFNVVAVVTAPDKPAGRGMKLQESAVKKYALANNIPLLQPVILKDPIFIEQLKSFNADIQVVIAFRMLPEIVWNMPPKGTINLHASLLPDYRGAAPINWAIINGETETGVSTFLLKHEIDTGDLILSEKVAIATYMNAGQLHDKLMQVGAEVIVKSLQAIASGNYKPIPQENSSKKIAPKIFTQNCLIDWNQTCLTIYNKIRGLSPYPGAITKLNGKILKIYSATFSIETSALTSGEVRTDHRKTLSFRAADGFVNLEEIQLEGKKRMHVVDFLKGYKSI